MGYQAIVSGVQSSDGRTPSDLVAYQIVHAIPGRVRIKVPALKRDSNYANRLQQSVVTLPEVSSVRINPASESILIYYSANDGSRESGQHDIHHKLITCIQQTSHTATAALPAVAPSQFISSAKPIQPGTAVTAASSDSTPEPIQPDALVAADAADSTPAQITPLEPCVQAVSDTSETTTSVASAPSETRTIFDTLGIPLPEGYVFDPSQLPIEIDQERKLLQFGVPAVILLSILNAELDKFELENEKHTDTERIQLDLDVSFVEHGLRLEGKANGRFRKRLFTNPLTKRKHYTPWVSLSAVGRAELAASMVDEALQFEMKELNVTGEPGEWHEELVKYAFDHLLKDRLIAKINQTLSNYDGTKLQNLFFQSQDGKDLLAKAQKIGFTRARIDELLGLFEINAKLTPDYLWLSIQF